MRMGFAAYTAGSLVRLAAIDHRCKPLCYEPREGRAQLTQINGLFRQGGHSKPSMANLRSTGEDQMVQSQTNRSGLRSVLALFAAIGFSGSAIASDVDAKNLLK